MASFIDIVREVRDTIYPDILTKFNQIIGISADGLAGKVDKVEGKGLSESDFSVEEKNKLSSIAENANNYTHPIKHSPSIIDGSGNGGKFLKVDGAENSGFDVITWSDVQGKPSSFIPSSHTHDEYEIASKRGAANGYAPLGSDGKIPSGYMSSLDVMDVFVPNDEASMLALNASLGDIAIRQDNNNSYMLVAIPASTIGNWKQLNVGGGVGSWNGLVGNITATTDHLPEGNNLYFTTDRFDQRLYYALSSNGSVSVAYDSETNLFSFHVAFEDIENMPTTISGFGISDAYTKNEIDTSETIVHKDSSTGAIILSTGTTAQRSPSPQEGMIRRNSELGRIEEYNGAEWSAVGKSDYDSFKMPCVVATTGNISTLSGLLTVDGVVLAAGDRVLVKNQTLSKNNGIYIISSGAWSRSIDSDSPVKLAGATVSILKGTQNIGKIYKTTFSSSDTIGSSYMYWYEILINAENNNTAYNVSVTHAKYLYVRDTFAAFNGLVFHPSNEEAYELLLRYSWVATTNITANVTTATAFATTKKYALIVCVGGGGGGAGAVVGEFENKVGGYAGDVCFAIVDLSMSPLATPFKYKVTIGAGGIGGTATDIPTNGGYTSVQIFDPTDLVNPIADLQCAGGSSGYYGTGYNINYAQNPVSGVCFYDGNFGTGDNQTNAFAGYGGGATFLGRGGAGGNAVSTPTAGAAGAANTGAGGGGGALYNSTRTNGGSGGSGKVIIYYPA